MTPEQLKLADELREYTALKFAGDCKCDKCQLVPRELIDRVCMALRTPDARVKEALQALYEWYDRDGSVGGASEIFEDNRDALSHQPGTGEAAALDSAPKSPALDPATVEACAKVVDRWTADITKAGDQFDKGVDIYAHANVSQGIAAAIRALAAKEGA